MKTGELAPGFADFVDAVAKIAAPRVAAGVDEREAIDTAMQELLSRQHWQLAQTTGHLVRVVGDGFGQHGWSPAGNAIVKHVARRVWEDVRAGQRGEP